MTKCYCKEILEKEFGRKVDNLYIHLSGCPETEDVKEYNDMPWYKKIFYFNPKRKYKGHKKILYET